MVILDQYVQLWLQHGKGNNEGEKIEISLQDISETLFCTDRNSTFISKQKITPKSTFIVYFGVILRLHPYWNILFFFTTSKQLPL